MTTASTTPAAAQERAAFNSWCNGLYRDHQEEIAWAAWQAARVGLEAMEKDAGRVLVDRDALAQVLAALNSPGHHIRELQATRNLPPSAGPNPINVLVGNYNAHVIAKGVQG